MATITRIDAVMNDKYINIHQPIEPATLAKLIVYAETCKDALDEEMGEYPTDLVAERLQGLGWVIPTEHWQFIDAICEMSLEDTSLTELCLRIFYYLPKFLAWDEENGENRSFLESVWLWADESRFPTAFLPMEELQQRVSSYWNS